jgi:integrase
MCIKSDQLVLNHQMEGFKMAKNKWYKSSFPNIQFKKHPSRKHGAKYDQYFRGSFQVAKKRKAINFGWASEGWTESKVWKRINLYKNNSKTGSGSTSLKEERETQENKKIELQKQKAIEDQENITFSFFWEEYYKPFSKNKKSWKAEESFYKVWIKAAIGKKPLKSISIFDLEKLKTKMEKAGKSQKTVQHILANIRQVFNRAISLDIFPGPNPVSKIKFQKINNQRVRFLKTIEAETLLTALIKKSTQVHDMALLSLHTGMRAKEIFRLAWSHIDFDNGTSHIVDTKNTESRYAYMSDAVKEMLQKNYQSKNTDLVFPDSNGNRIKYMSKTFPRVVEALGFNTGVIDDRNKVVFHTLRHTFASWQVQDGMDLYTLQKLMGHKSFQMVQRYAHLAPDNLKKATTIFNRMDKKGKVIPFPKQA